MEKAKNRVFIDYLCAVCFSIIVGSVSLANKICVVYGMPILIVAVRYLLAVIGNFTGQRIGLIHVNLKGKGKKPLLVLGAFCYVGSYLLQVCGLMYAPSVINGILLATVPIWSEIIAGIMLKEKTTLKQNFFLFLSAGCVIAMFVIGSFDSLKEFSVKGFLILLVSCIFEAMNNIIIRYVKEEYTPMEISFVSCSISAVISIIVLLGQIIIGAFPLESIGAAFCEWKFVAALLFLGFFGTFAAGVLRGQILHDMPAIKATAWYNVCTPVTVIFGVIFLKESFHFYQLVCTIGILIGVFGTQICKERK